ncbi:MAG: DUF488 family protein [Rariglobus sp.]
MIKTKSVHSPVDTTGDGLRILATRLRGRGLPSSRYDVWMANLGPSQELLTAFQQGSISWVQFGRRYRAELFEASAIDQRNPLIKNHGQKFTLRLIQRIAKDHDVTLLCHCAETEHHCHRHLLRSWLSAKI